MAWNSWDEIFARTNLYGMFKKIVNRALAELQHFVASVTDHYTTYKETALKQIVYKQHSMILAEVTIDMAQQVGVKGGLTNLGRSVVDFQLGWKRRLMTNVTFICIL